jgi:hypothetical protein
MRAFLRKTGLVVLRAINLGGQHHCPVCQRRFARFMRRGDNLMCVGCRSYARHRLMMLYIQRETDLLRKPGRVLQLRRNPGCMMSSRRRRRRTTSLPIWRPAVMCGFSRRARPSVR